MVSDITMETTLLDAPMDVILESLSGEVPLQKRVEEESVGLESECGDEMFPAFAWKK